MYPYMQAPMPPPMQPQTPYGYMPANGGGPPPQLAGYPPYGHTPYNPFGYPGVVTGTLFLSVLIRLKFNRRSFCVAPYPYPPPQMLPSPGPPSAGSESMGLVVRGARLVRPKEDEQPPMRWEPGKDCTYYIQLYDAN